jgi:hypothetical protein
MIVVYDKNSHAIIGHCSQIFDSGKWREPTLEEIYPNRDRSNLAVAYMPDDARFVGYGPTNWRIRKDENGAVLGVERLPALHLACDAKDTDDDGVPDIPADGNSVATITATTADGSDTEIMFRTSRGTLSSRKAETSNGSAAVEIKAGVETVAATITAEAKGYRTATLQLEMVPTTKKPSPKGRGLAP